MAAPIFPWLRHFIRTPSTSRRRLSSPLGLESLEDRLLLTAYGALGAQASALDPLAPPPPAAGAPSTVVATIVTPAAGMSSLLTPAGPAPQDPAPGTGEPGPITGVPVNELSLDRSPADRGRDDTNHHGRVTAPPVGGAAPSSSPVNGVVSGQPDEPDPHELDFQRRLDTFVAPAATAPADGEPVVPAAGTEAAESVCPTGMAPITLDDAECQAALPPQSAAVPAVGTQPASPAVPAPAAPAPVAPTAAAPGPPAPPAAAAAAVPAAVAAPVAVEIRRVNFLTGADEALASQVAAARERVTVAPRESVLATAAMSAPPLPGPPGAAPVADLPPAPLGPAVAPGASLVLVGVPPPDVPVIGAEGAGTPWLFPAVGAILPEVALATAHDAAPVLVVPPAPAAALTAPAPAAAPRPTAPDGVPEDPPPAHGRGGALGLGLLLAATFAAGISWLTGTPRAPAAPGLAEARRAQDDRRRGKGRAS